MAGSTHVDWANLWAIWLMREEEGQQAVLDTTLDQSGTDELRRLARAGSEAAQIRLLADRAEKFLSTRTPAITVADLRNVLTRACGIVVVIAVAFGLILAFAASELFVLDSEGRVNVYRALIGLSILFGLAILPAAVLVAYAWNRVRFAKSHRSPPWYSRVAANVLLHAQTILLTTKRWLTRSGLQDCNQAPPSTFTRVSLPRWLMKAPSLSSLITGTIGNLLAVLILLFTLFGGCFRVATTQFDFVVKTNARLERTRFWLECFRRPVAKLGFTVPSDDALSWARNADFQRDRWCQSRVGKGRQSFQRKLAISEPGLSPEDVEKRWQLELADLQATEASDWAAETDRYRDEWSFFFLGLLLIYGIVPRGVLLVFSVIALRDCKRELQPDVNDDYFRSTLDNLLAGGRRSVAEVSSALQAAAAVQPEPVSEPDRAPLGLTAPPRYVQRDERIWSLGYADEMPAESWPGELRSIGSTAVNMASVVDSKSKAEALCQIRTADPQPGAILIWYDAIANLDENWKAFVEAVNVAMQEPSRIVIAFYNGSRLREQYDNDAELVGKQISAKRNPCLKIGIPRDNLVEFDPNQASAEAICQFAARLRSALGKRSPRAETNDTLCREAFASLRTEWAKLWPNTDVVLIEQATQRTARRLFQLYRDAPNSLFRFTTGMVDSSVLERAEQCVTEHGGSAFSIGELESMKQVLCVSAALVKMAQKVKDHRGWLVAASVAGAAIATGGAALALPLLPAAATLAFLGCVPWFAGGGLLAGSLAGYGLIRDPNNTNVTAASTHPERSDALDTFIRSNCLLIAVLESQPDAEAEVARRATAVADAVGDSPVDTLDGGFTTIERAESALLLSQRNNR